MVFLFTQAACSWLELSSDPDSVGGDDQYSNIDPQVSSKFPATFVYIALTVNM